MKKIDCDGCGSLVPDSQTDTIRRYYGEQEEATLCLFCLHTRLAIAVQIGRVFEGQDEMVAMAQMFNTLVAILKVK